MAQNITLLGASYTAVPAVTLPKTGGGTAKFSDASVTTAVASDVAEGKIFLLADGTQATGTASGGGGGYDIPTFTITFDSSYSTVLSVTCDKTYANCLSIFNSGNNTAMSLVTAQGTSDEFYGGVTVTATGTGVITYTGYNVAHPAFDIVYNSNGTISYVEPSAFVDTLNVTVNGTYYADGDKDWTEVNVNVSGGTPSQTQHTILFEFTDETSTSITAYWDGTFISDAITATTPTSYGGKTVDSASLDGVAWYTKPSQIPLNTQLVDYNDVLTGYTVESDGSVITSEAWNCITDYIPINPTMTFSFKCTQYANIGFYNNNKAVVRTVVANDIKESAADYVASGYLTPAIIPSNAAYVVLCGNTYGIEETLSLIRTA